MDFDREGLLDGLSGADRTARRTLLERLHADGVPIEELKAAIAEDRLALLPMSRSLGGRRTARELHDVSGVPVELLLRMRRLLGLPEAAPDDRVFGEEDVAQARSTKLFLEAGFDVDTLTEMTRVLGESMARLAATTTAAFAETFLRPGDTELEVAERFDQLAEQLTPALGPVLEASFNAHLREAIARGRLAATERESGRLEAEESLSVCFADLVGFTRLGGELEVHALGGVAGRLAHLAAEAAEPPVRLIKTIGDAVMFVSPDPGALVAAALELVDAAEAEELPALRAGIACGPAGLRAGDYFGHGVNLASRVTGTARPGSVLCTEEVKDAAPTRFRWSSAGRFHLKGIHESLTLYRAHVSDPEDAEASAHGGDGARLATSRRGGGRRRRRGSR